MNSDFDDDVICIRSFIPPTISKKDAKKIKREVKKSFIERYKKQCAESNEYPLKKKIKNSSFDVPCLSTCGNVTPEVSIVKIRDDLSFSHADSNKISKSVELSKIETSSLQQLFPQDKKIVSKRGTSNTGRKIPLDNSKMHSKEEQMAGCMNFCSADTVLSMQLESEKKISDKCNIKKRKMTSSVSEDCEHQYKKMLLDTKPLGTKIDTRQESAFSSLDNEVSLPKTVLPPKNNTYKNIMPSGITSPSRKSEFLTKGYKCSLSLEKINIKSDSRIIDPIKTSNRVEPQHVISHSGSPVQRKIAAQLKTDDCINFKQSNMYERGHSVELEIAEGSDTRQESAFSSLDNEVSLPKTVLPPKNNTYKNIMPSGITSPSRKSEFLTKGYKCSLSLEKINIKSDSRIIDPIKTSNRVEPQHVISHSGSPVQRKIAAQLKTDDCINFKQSNMYERGHSVELETAEGSDTRQESAFSSLDNEVSLPKTVLPPKNNTYKNIMPSGITSPSRKSEFLTKGYKCSLSLEKINIKSDSRIIDPIKTSNRVEPQHVISHSGSPVQRNIAAQLKTDDCINFKQSNIYERGHSVELETAEGSSNILNNDNLPIKCVVLEQLPAKNSTCAKRLKSVSMSLVKDGSKIQISSTPDRQTLNLPENIISQSGSSARKKIVTQSKTDECITSKQPNIYSGKSSTHKESRLKSVSMSTVLDDPKIHIPSTSSDGQNLNLSENVNQNFSSGETLMKYSEVPPPGTKLEMIASRLHNYISILCSNVDSTGNDLTDSISKNMSITLSKIQHSSDSDSTITKNESTFTKGEKTVFSDDRIVDRNTCSLSTIKEKEMIAARSPNRASGNCFVPDDKMKNAKTFTLSKEKNNVVIDSSSINILTKQNSNVATAHKQSANNSFLCSDVEIRSNITFSPSKAEEKVAVDFTSMNVNGSALQITNVQSLNKTNSSLCLNGTSANNKQNSAPLCNTSSESILQSPVRAVQSPSFKLSHHISSHPNKFSAHNINLANSFDIMMTAQKTPKKNSPSKKLGKNSPLKYVRNGRTPNKWKYRTSPSKPSQSKVLNFNDCRTEEKSEPSFSQELRNEHSFNRVSFSEEYVTYFEKMLHEVMKDKDMVNVISNEELTIVSDFQKLKNQAKNLYIRMLSRKYCWHRVSHIKYNNIDVPAAFTELELSGLVTSDYNSEELAVLLDLLKLQELKSLCKTFRIQPITVPKPKLIQALLDYGKNQTTLIAKQNDSSYMVKNRLREMLGHCIKLCALARQSFHRILLLFSLPHQDDDDDRESSKQLLLLHYVNTKKVEYPAYTIQKSRPIFSSRDDLLRFEEANDLLNQLNKAIDSKSWKDAQSYGQEVREQFRRILEEDATSDEAKTMPLFLRRYTAGSTYAYALTKAIEAFKKSKDLLPECVVTLEELLCQDVYLPQYRGRWYEQLALILQVHLKKYDEAAVVLIEAMRDEHLNEVHQQTISSRGSLLLKLRKGLTSILNKLKLVESIKTPVAEPLSLTIRAKSLQNNAPGRKQVYVQEDTYKQEITYSSVEEFAISHYKSVGFMEGVHAEGSIIITLFGLMFWDVIYEHGVIDVFRTSYQREPLDLSSGEFYSNRKEIIDKRLEDLHHWNIDFVRNHMMKMFREHQGKESIVNWQRFQSPQLAVDLIKCMGLPVFAKILERVVKHYRAVRSGFPDLVVWNPETLKCKFVEVKGPGDRLSVAQKMWLNYLTECNADAEVCYVHTTGAKMLKRKKPVAAVPELEVTT